MSVYGSEIAKRFSLYLLCGVPYINGTREVYKKGNSFFYKLYSTDIVEKLEDESIIIDTKGHHTATTFASLNAFDNVNIRCKKGFLTLNGKEWNGVRTHILNDTGGRA